MKLYTGWLLSLVVALAIGWLLGQIRRRKSAVPPIIGNTSTPPSYYQSLSSLIDDSTDDTILHFIQELPVSSETLPVHLALARQLRRHGLTERALSGHQLLLDSPGLTRADKVHVRMELGVDFESMGLFDRAEELFQQVVEESNEDVQRVKARGALVKLYAKEGDWERAVKASEGLGAEWLSKMRVELSHYWCEVAYQHMRSQNPQAAIAALRSAQEYDANCARASLLRAQLLMDQSRWEGAIQELKQVYEQQRNLFVLALPALARCYREIGNDKALETYLERCMVQTPMTSLLLALVELKRRVHGERIAKRYLTEQLRDYPSLRGARTLLELEIADQPAPPHSMYALEQVLGLMERNVMNFRCRRCGYESQQMHWQCPSCRSWGSVDPVVGVAGE